MTINDIFTDRLILRSTRGSDSDFCLSLWLDGTTGKYLSDPPRELADEAELNFAKNIEKDEGWYPLVILWKETWERIGTCSMVPKKADSVWDPGYCVHPDWQRRGVATEAVQAMIGFARDHGGRSITADVARNNAASNALLRRLGFRIVREGSFRKRLTDIVYPSYTYQLDLP